MTTADGARTSLRRRTVLAAVAAAVGLAAVGSSEMESIERTRPRGDAQLRGTSAYGVVESHDEGALPVALERVGCHLSLGVPEAPMDREQNLGIRVVGRGPLLIGEQGGLDGVALVLRHVALDQCGTVHVEGHAPRSREMSSVVVGVPARGFWRTTGAGGRSARRVIQPSAIPRSRLS